MKKRTKPCKNYPHCDGKVSVDSERLDCDNCRARIRAWLKRNTTEIMRYVTELRKRSARMGEVTDDKGLDYRPTYRK